MEIVFEKASKNKEEAIIELLSALYTELGEESKSIAFLTNDLITWFIESAKTEIYLVKNIAMVVGIITLTESQAIYSGGKYGSLNEMYIKPAFRNRGIGDQCIEKIKLIAFEKGWKRIEVTAPTEQQLQRTIRFYEERGFVFTGPKFKLTQNLFRS